MSKFDIEELLISFTLKKENELIAINQLGEVLTLHGIIAKKNTPKIINQNSLILVLKSIY